MQLKINTFARSERLLGGGVFGIGIAILYGLIPLGIDGPRQLDHITLSPDFWPRIIAAIFTLMGLGLVIQPDQTVATDDSETAGGRWNRWWRLCLILGALFGFYFAVSLFGMVVPAMFFLFALMYFAGERRRLRLVATAVVTPLLLYGFFRVCCQHSDTVRVV